MILSKKTIIEMGLMSIVLFFASGAYLSASTVETCEISFSGIASGGELILFENLNRNARYVSIQTKNGETASTIAQRLTNAINDQDPFSWCIPSGKQIITAEDGIIKGLAGDCYKYLIAGSEMGLGIPFTPTSLTCKYDSAGKQLILTWQSPELYDSVRILYNWDKYNHKGVKQASGTSEQYVFDLSKYPENMIKDMDIWVWGEVSGVPSGATAMHVEGHSQEELFGIPFVNGVAPNWNKWSIGDLPEKIQFAQQNRPGKSSATRRGHQQRYNAIPAADEKPFYQIIKTTSPVAKGGIWRKFLGLVPGHTYKISVRMSTLQAKASQGDWSYSFHAIADDAEGSMLTNEQLAGLASLPDGRMGSDAARLADYGPQNLTKPDKYDTQITEITLPENSTSITVWLRCSGDMGDNGVAYDWIKLEDITVK